MRGIIAGLVGGLVTWLCAACGAPSEFSCASDDDCVFSGQPGICTSNGHCAYPDPACTSGYSFAPGAPSNIAGNCVDASEVSATATTSSGTGSAAGTAESVGPTGLETSAATASSGTVTATAAMTAGTDSSGSSCPQTDAEDNNDIDSAVEVDIDVEAGCGVQITGTLSAGDPTDFFELKPDTRCEQTGSVAADVFIEDPFDVCIWAECDTDETFSECSGVTTDTVDLDSCCDQNGPIIAKYACPDVKIFLSVAGTVMCTEYTASVMTD